MKMWVGAWPMFGAPVALFATANWVHILFEEAKMRRQFGAVYDNYVARVAALDMTSFAALHESAHGTTKQTSGHANHCPLLGVKRTYCGRTPMPANDPKRTW